MCGLLRVLVFARTHVCVYISRHFVRWDKAMAEKKGPTLSHPPNPPPHVYASPNWILYYRSSQVWTTHFPLPFFFFFLPFISFILLMPPLLLLHFILSQYFIFWLYFCLPLFFPTASSWSWNRDHCSVFTLSVKVSCKFSPGSGGPCGGCPLWLSPYVMKHIALCDIRIKNTNIRPPQLTCGTES